MIISTTTTERLLIETLTPEDAGFMFELLNSKGWLEFIGNRNVHSASESKSFIKKIIKARNLNYLVVKLKSNGVAVGIVSFIKRDYLPRFDIGFAFLPQFTGCGYAYEAAKKILSTVTHELQYSPVLATTKPENIKSIRLLIKLGLHYEKEIEVGNEIVHLYSNEIQNIPQDVEIRTIELS